MPPRLLQVCNVGQILGGTAACAWTVTRSFPALEHHVAFLSNPTPDTITAFAGCKWHRWHRVTASAVADIRPDVVILHNTARTRVEGPLPAVTIQYLHSRIDPASAHLTLHCSRWLAAQYRRPSAHVCLQAVPLPDRPPIQRDTRSLRDHLVVGRICTPHKKKWPPEIINLYADLSARFPAIDWEFVGCPTALQPRLMSACRNRAAFFPASWSARARLWHWNALLYHNPHVTESFGRTVAEAMLAGCIPIVDARGGFLEQIAPHTGFLCRQADDFANALHQIATPSRRHQISRTARAHSNTHFTPESFATRLTKHINQATTHPQT